MQHDEEIKNQETVHFLEGFVMKYLMNAQPESIREDFSIFACNCEFLISTIKLHI
jgi:hypothetical protein